MSGDITPKGWCMHIGDYPFFRYFSSWWMHFEEIPHKNTPVPTWQPAMHRIYAVRFIASFVHVSRRSLGNAPRLSFPTLASPPQARQVKSAVFNLHRNGLCCMMLCAFFGPEFDIDIATSGWGSAKGEMGMSQNSGPLKTIQLPKHRPFEEWWWKSGRWFHVPGPIRMI